MSSNYKRLFRLLPLLLISLTFAQAELTEIARSGDQSSSARIEAGEFVNNHPAIAVVFEGTGDLHYYATSDSAPAPGLELKITAQADGLTFGDPVFPEYEYFNDTAKGKIEVFVGDFKVLLPIIEHTEDVTQTNVNVTIAGITCTSQLCLPPFTKQLAASVDLSKWPEISVAEAKAPIPTAQTSVPAIPLEKTLPLTKTMPIVEQAPGETDKQLLSTSLSDWTTIDATEADEAASVAWYFLLAILAGLSINIMPCVLPVIPLIIMRLVSQAKQAPAKRVALGFSFCGGIVLFFAVFAALSVIVKLTTGAALDLNSLYRNPTAVITLFLCIVFFALVLLDLLTLTLPSSVSNQQAGGSGFAGSIGMGFFAGVLSTPCSGAILGAVLVWAQTQPLYISTTALLLMGVGMALPYAILVSIPKLLDYVPKPGTWMEIFKKTGGFLLLIIAVKFTLTALPKDRLIDVLLYGVIFAFAVWMWGSWVGFSTQKGKKWLTRLVALGIAVGFGIWLLPAAAPTEIAWQPYDASTIQQAIAFNQPVLIKFSADWCTNCKILEKNVYHRPDVEALIGQKDILAIKADTTLADYPAAIDLNTVFGEAGSVPLTVILDPADHTMVKLRGIFSPAELKQTLNERF